MRKKIIAICLFLTSITLGATAQSGVLKLYRGDKLAFEYRKGDVIVFQLKNDAKKNIYTYGIEALDTSGFMVRSGKVQLENIATIWTHQHRSAGRAFSRMLYIFAGSWVVFSAVDVLYGDGDFKQVGTTAAWVAGTSVATGFALDKIFDHKVHKLDGEKRFLKVVYLQPR